MSNSENFNRHSGINKIFFIFTILKTKNMTEFMMIFRNAYTPDVKLSPEQMQESVKQWQDWIGSIAAQGKFVGTTRLSSVGAKIMKPNNIITDGPYMELKEIVGGSLTVKADSMEDAMKLAVGCPVFNYGGSLELREVIPVRM